MMKLRLREDSYDLDNQTKQSELKEYVLTIEAYMDIYYNYRYKPNRNFSQTDVEEQAVSDSELDLIRTTDIFGETILEKFKSKLEKLKEFSGIVAEQCYVDDNTTIKDSKHNPFIVYMYLSIPENISVDDKLNATMRNLIENIDLEYDLDAYSTLLEDDLVFELYFGVDYVNKVNPYIE